MAIKRKSDVLNFEENLSQLSDQPIYKRHVPGTNSLLLSMSAPYSKGTNELHNVNTSPGALSITVSHYPSNC